MPGRTIAIGDIHGCLDALNQLLESIEPHAADRIVTLGDYVDRGPDSKGVIDRLIALSETCELIALKGNHEEMMLRVTDHGEPHTEWARHGGIETLDSYGFDGRLDFFPPSHRRFLDGLLDAYETETHLFVHAAYDPQLPLEEQPPYLLRWHSLLQGVPGPQRSGKTAVVGHTANREGEIFHVEHLICLDTYCYGGGWLTALAVHSGEVWQASEA
jgi:serine/threonine protein phosphatase 1